jgi:hypothetical protein
MGEAGEQLQYPVKPVPGITLYTTPQDRNKVKHSVGSGMFIPDPIFSILDPGSTSKNLTILLQKNCFQALGNMIRVDHPGSGS